MQKIGGVHNIVITAMRFSENVFILSELNMMFSLRIDALNIVNLHSWSAAAFTTLDLNLPSDR
ncbi:hypothetical protein [Klebsiella oxytoca]|uniref:hypothetical protein n=1 Tax=Klebsiella oxytoca TaxID=571 RepID=UPI001CCB310C|nr:hypothetical protein [Klebsiella oxytoca]